MPTVVCLRIGVRQSINKRSKGLHDSWHNRNEERPAVRVSQKHDRGRAVRPESAERVGDARVKFIV